jgi:hypothetical protein
MKYKVLIDKIIYFLGYEKYQFIGISQRKYKV